MAIDPIQMRLCFKSWLLSRVPRGKWASFAKKVWTDLDDPVRNFTRIRNEGEEFTLEDIVLIANYFDMDLIDIAREVMQVYRMQAPQIASPKKHSKAG